MQGNYLPKLILIHGFVNRLRMIGIGVRRRHVLPHQQAHFVCPIVPAGGFHFDVLSHHVEAKSLHGLDVGLERVFGGRRVDAIRPEPLIQRPDFKDELVVEHHLLEAANLRQTDFSHPEVAADAILLGLAVHKRHVHIIEERAVGRPQASVFHRQRQFRVGPGREGLDHAARFFDFYNHTGSGGGRGRVHRDIHAAIVHVRNNVQILNGLPRNGFQPHGLPDARRGRVHDAAGMQRLLAARLPALVCRIEYAHNQFLRPGSAQIRRDVIVEGRIAPFMNADAFPVHENFRLVIHRAEIQQHLPAVPSGRHGEGAAIPQPLVMLHHSRQRGFDRVRNQNRAGKRSADGNRLVCRAALILPDSVQIKPLGTRQLGTRVFRQGHGGIDLAGPARHQGRFFGRPGCRVLRRNGTLRQRRHQHPAGEPESQISGSANKRNTVHNEFS